MSWQGLFLSVWVLSTEAALPREENEIIFLCANSSQLLVVFFDVYSPTPRLLKCVQHAEPNLSPFIRPAEDLKNRINNFPTCQIQQET